LPVVLAGRLARPAVADPVADAVDVGVADPGLATLAAVAGLQAGAVPIGLAEVLVHADAILVATALARRTVPVVHTRLAAIIHAPPIHAELPHVALVGVLARRVQAHAALADSPLEAVAIDGADVGLGAEAVDAGLVPGAVAVVLATRGPRLRAAPVLLTDLALPAVPVTLARIGARPSHIAEAAPDAIHVLEARVGLLAATVASAELSPRTVPVVAPTPALNLAHALHALLPGVAVPVVLAGAAAIGDAMPGHADVVPGAVPIPAAGLHTEAAVADPLPEAVDVLGAQRRLGAEAVLAGLAPGAIAVVLAPLGPRLGAAPVGLTDLAIGTVPVASARIRAQPRDVAEAPAGAVDVPKAHVGLLATTIPAAELAPGTIRVVPAAPALDLAHALHALLTISAVPIDAAEAAAVRHAVTRDAHVLPRTVRVAPAGLRAEAAVAHPRPEAVRVVLADIGLGAEAVDAALVPRTVVVVVTARRPWLCAPPIFLADLSGLAGVVVDAGVLTLAEQVAEAVADAVDVLGAEDLLDAASIPRAELEPRAARVVAATAALDLAHALHALLSASAVSVVLTDPAPVGHAATGDTGLPVGAGRVVGAGLNAQPSVTPARAEAVVVGHAEVRLGAEPVHTALVPATIGVTLAVGVRRVRSTPPIVAAHLAPGALRVGEARILADVRLADSVAPAVDVGPARERLLAAEIAPAELVAGAILVLPALLLEHRRAAAALHAGVRRSALEVLATRIDAHPGDAVALPHAVDVAVAEGRLDALPALAGLGPLALVVDLAHGPRDATPSDAEQLALAVHRAPARIGALAEIAEPVPTTIEITPADVRLHAGRRIRLEIAELTTLAVEVLGAALGVLAAPRDALLPASAGVLVGTLQHADRPIAEAPGQAIAVHVAHHRWVATPVAAAGLGAGAVLVVLALHLDDRRLAVVRDAQIVAGAVGVTDAGRGADVVVADAALEALVVSLAEARLVAGADLADLAAGAVVVPLAVVATSGEAAPAHGADEPLHAILVRHALRPGVRMTEAVRAGEAIPAVGVPLARVDAEAFGAAPVAEAVAGPVADQRLEALARVWVAGLLPGALVIDLAAAGLAGHTLGVGADPGLLVGAVGVGHARLHTADATLEADQAAHALAAPRLTGIDARLVGADATVEAAGVAHAGLRLVAGAVEADLLAVAGVVVGAGFALDALAGAADLPLAALFVVGASGGCALAAAVGAGAVYAAVGVGGAGVRAEALVAVSLAHAVVVGGALRGLRAAPVGAAGLVPGAIEDAVAVAGLPTDAQPRAANLAVGTIRRSDAGGAAVQHHRRPHIGRVAIASAAPIVAADGAHQEREQNPPEPHISPPSPPYGR